MEDFIEAGEERRHRVASGDGKPQEERRRMRKRERLGRKRREERWEATREGGAEADEEVMMGKWRGRQGEKEAGRGEDMGWGGFAFTKGI